MYAKLWKYSEQITNSRFVVLDFYFGQENRQFLPLGIVMRRAARGISGDSQRPRGFLLRLHFSYTFQDTCSQNRVKGYVAICTSMMGGPRHPCGPWGPSEHLQTFRGPCTPRTFQTLLTFYSFFFIFAKFLRFLTFFTFSPNCVYVFFTATTYRLFLHKGLQSEQLRVFQSDGSFLK